MLLPSSACLSQRHAVKGPMTLTSRWQGIRDCLLGRWENWMEEELEFYEAAWDKSKWHGKSRTQAEGIDLACQRFCENPSIFIWHSYEPLSWWLFTTLWSALLFLFVFFAQLFNFLYFFDSERIEFLIPLGDFFLSNVKRVRGWKRRILLSLSCFLCPYIRSMSDLWSSGRKRLSTLMPNLFCWAVLMKRLFRAPSFLYFVGFLLYYHAYFTLKSVELGSWAFFLLC